jgi:hypothetical protein
MAFWLCSARLIRVVGPQPCGEAEASGEAAQQQLVRPSAGDLEPSAALSAQVLRCGCGLQCKPSAGPAVRLTQCQRNVRKK